METIELSVLFSISLMEIKPQEMPSGNKHHVQQFMRRKEEVSLSQSPGVATSVSKGKPVNLLPYCWAVHPRTADYC